MITHAEDKIYVTLIWPYHKKNNGKIKKTYTIIWIMIREHHKLTFASCGTKRSNH